MARLIVLLVLLLSILPVQADRRDIAQLRTQLESTVQLRGSITINPDGTVQGHELDAQAHSQLSPELETFIDRNVASWRFEPVRVNGQVVRAKVPMHLRLVANQDATGNYVVRIASTYFGGDSTEGLATDSPRVKGKMTPPKYPLGALRAGGEGTVYLILEFGRDGKVLHAGAAQVNLRALGTDRQMQDLREVLADASIRAALTWTFLPPTTGEEAGADSWKVNVPINFRITDRRLGPTRREREQAKTESQWETYLPGPINLLPWAGEEQKTAGNPDALPDSGVFPLKQGARLLNPPTA